jgi:hypothetical protein
MQAKQVAAVANLTRSGILRAMTSNGFLLPPLPTVTKLGVTQQVTTTCRAHHSFARKPGASRHLTCHSRYHFTAYVHLLLSFYGLSPSSVSALGLFS